MSANIPLKKRIKRFLKKFETTSLVTTVLGVVIYCYALLVGITTRWKKINIEQTYKLWAKEKAVILIIWHGRTLLPCYFWKNKKQFPMSALVSPHRDGRVIAAVLKCFGIKVIDGSTNENAREAALGLMREIQQGSSITIIPDGPKGPNMKLTPSALYYAQKSGLPIIGMTYSIKGAKLVTKSWDQMLLPPLFSKGTVATTKPFYINKDITAEEFEKTRLQIETALTELTWKIDRDLGLPKVEQGTKSRPKKYQTQGKQ